MLTGEIAEAPDAPPASDNPDYLAKYGGLITGGPWGTAEVFAETYSVALRFRPRRVRGY